MDGNPIFRFKQRRVQGKPHIDDLASFIQRLFREVLDEILIVPNTVDTPDNIVTDPQMVQNIIQPKKSC